MATESLCWSCLNCKTANCAWVTLGEQVWDRALLGSKYSGLQLYIVQECPHYQGKGAKRFYGQRIKKEDSLQLLSLIIDEGATQQEAADAYGVSPRAVYKRLDKGMKDGTIKRVSTGVYQWVNK